MPDYYEQPAYLKEIETTTVTQTPEAYTPEPSTRPKLSIPTPLLIAVGVIILLIILFLILRGRTTTPPTTTTQKVTLQWWGAFLDPSVVKPLIDEYQVANSNVTIEYADKFPKDGNYATASENYRTELNRVLKANDPIAIPDIFMVENTWAGDYESFVKSSNSYDYDTFKSAFYPAVVTDFTSASTKSVYGVPLWIDDLAILYNKDMLKNSSLSSPPTDWTNFTSAAKTLTKRSSGKITQAGFAAGTGTNVTYAPQILNLLMAQNGVQLVDSNGQPQFASDSDSLVALNAYKDFLNTQTGTWNGELKNDAASFLEQKVAMIVTTSYKYREIKQFNELYQLGIDMGISQFPQLQGQATEVLNWADYWGAMVAGSRPNSTAAWAFLKWITDPAQLRKLSKNEADFNKQFGFMYPRSDMQQDNANDDNLKVFNASLPTAQSWKMYKGTDVKKEFIKLIDQSGAAQTSITATQSAIQTLMNNKGKL